MKQLLVFHFLCIIIMICGRDNNKDVANGNRLENTSSSFSLMEDIQMSSLHSIDVLWENLLESNEINQPTTKNVDILRTFEKIHKNITEIENFINPSDYYLFASDWTYALADSEIVNINTFYETFVRFQIENLNDSVKPQLAWTDLAQTYLQNSDFGIVKSLEKIHRYVTTETESENLFKKIQQEMQSNICNMRQSPHQTLYNLYNTIALTELKGNVIIQFSYLILRMYNKGDFIKEAISAKQEYNKRAKEKMKQVKKALIQAERSIYKCDPKQHVEGVTYTKLTKLLQGYIENEVNLNPYGTCRENCKYYSNTQYHGCYKNQFCANQPPCPGRVLECRYVDSDMKICVSSNSERRYDWVNYENGKTLGTTGVCERHNLFNVDSWWRYLFWHCSYCLCLCDDYQHDSERYFNLQAVTSDTEDNKIVTGVRIVKNNKIIHFQIQQGILKPRGVVDKKSLSWKPIETYSVEDTKVKNNVNYTTLGWFDRAIDLDDVILPSGHVVTGVRFRKIGNHLNLEVRASPINFATGKVFQNNKSYWVGNDNTEANWDNPRKEIILHNPDIPIRHGPHSLNSKHDQFIQFQPTSFQNDVGQTTVPFLDSQAITSQGFPISGVGLIHRGQYGSGGFLAPKLISFNFEPHLYL